MHDQTGKQILLNVKIFVVGMIHVFTDIMGIAELHIMVPEKHDQTL
jgi:hypothetical protein